MKTEINSINNESTNDIKKSAIILIYPDEIIAKSHAKRLDDLHKYSTLLNLPVFKIYDFTEHSLENFSTNNKQKFLTTIQYVMHEKSNFNGITCIIVEDFSYLKYAYLEIEFLDNMINRGDLEIHLVNENRIFTQEANPQDSLCWEIIATLAGSYVVASDKDKDLVDKAYKTIDKVEWNMYDRLIFGKAAEIIDSFVIDAKLEKDIIEYIKIIHKAKIDFCMEYTNELNMKHKENEVYLNMYTANLLDSIKIADKDYFDVIDSLMKERNDIISQKLINTYGDYNFSRTIYDLYLITLGSNKSENFNKLSRKAKCRIINLLFTELKINNHQTEYRLRPLFNRFTKNLVNSKYLINNNNLNTVL